MVFRTSIEKMTKEERDVLEELSGGAIHEVLDGRSDESEAERERLRLDEENEMIRWMMPEGPSEGQ